MLKDLLKQRPQLTRAALACLLLVICGLLIPRADNPIQHWLGDLAQRHASDSNSDATVVVAIDAESQSLLGQWPWSNRVHANLIEKLREQGVRAIAFTTPLTSPINTETGQVADTAADRVLAQAMRTQGQVVIPIDVSTSSGITNDRNLVSQLTRTQRHFARDSLDHAISVKALSGSNTEIVGAAAALGQLLMPTDADDITRRDYAAVKLGEQALPSMSVALANLVTEQRNSLVVTAEQLQLTSTMRTITLHDDLSFTPRFSGKTPVTIPYWQALAGQFDPQLVKNKSIVVGFTEGVGADRIQTPVGNLPRTMVVAMCSDALLNQHIYRRPLWVVLLEWLLVFTVVILAATTFIKLSTRQNLIIVVALSSSALLATYLLMSMSTVTLQVAPQLIALLACFVLSLALSPATASKQSITSPAISMETLKTLALTLHGQGQLDMAFETLRRCQPNQDTLDLLYRLATDYERRNESLKAAQAYRYVGEMDQNYKDATAKAQQLQLAIERPKPAQSTPASVARPKPLTNISRPQPIAKESPHDPNKQSLGRYEIERQIGKGAMGVVYLGRDPKINRVVAIKAIPLAEEFEDQDLIEARERFFREAEMAGRLNHPGIVTIFDAGEDRGLAYIAMEYIRGEHLSFYCEPHRLLPVRKSLTMMIRVAEALNYAHLQNVVHRDIKPANIMFNIETDALKITDFGIARLSDVSRTKTGIVLGTPSFMSPEQLEGRPLDGRSDLFGLGVTMYQMLTGQLPFRADSMTRLMNNIATEPHPPIRSLRPELPECMEQVIDRCLAKSAADRYQTGVDMADAIRNCLRGLA
ncbi:MAG: CHASE2 domain-containing serine/threonine-protein kinase [Steroidobacteraceae bacterium]